MTPQLTELENGLRIISETRSNIETVSVGIWVDVGARHESPLQNGMTHCIEHMLFKGTRSRSARDIALEIETVGGHMNAYTSRDHTTYYARVLKEDLNLAVDLLSDMLLHSLFDEKELEREKEVILQEIGQTNDTPDDVIFDHLQEIAFKGQALGRSILGTSERVSSFQRPELLSFLSDKYHAGSLVVSAVGNLNHDALVALVADKFAELKPGRVSLPEKAHFTGGQYLEERPLEQVHLTLGYEGLAFDHPDYYALQIYTTLLGGGMSSRLFQEIRENRGLAYSVYSFASSHRETGLFGIYAGTAPESLSELVPLIKEQMLSLTATLDETEIALGKAQLKAGLLMALESTTARMEQMGRQMLIYGRTVPTSEIIRSVDAVDAGQLVRVAERLAQQQASVVVALGGGNLSAAFN